MQNLVANTILKRATGKPNAEIMLLVVPFQYRETVSDRFSELMSAIFPFFLLLAYIPLLYRTVYRIVFEKVTRVKESMRMMGMGEFSYWLSWFTYYTLVNTILTTLCTLVLIINCFKPQTFLIIWFYIWLYGQSLFGLLLII